MDILNHGRWAPMVALGMSAWFAVPAVSAGLVGHWEFDEGTGVAIVDSSGSGNHGTLINPKTGTWTQGHHGGGLYLDGTTGAGSTYVTIPDAPSLRISGAATFAAWIRCDDTDRDAPILDKEGPGSRSFWFGAYPGSHFGVLLASGTGDSWAIQMRQQGSVTKGLWMHVASTWDGTTIRHYLNGVPLAETAAFAGPLFASGTPLVIGANIPFGNTAFQGVLDDLRLYDVALGAAEVSALAGYIPGLVGYWSFDEGGGTQVADGSGLGNHGVVENLQPDTWTAGVRGGALYFPGVVGSGSTHVAIPDSASLRISGDISVAAWVRCDDVGRDAPILAKEGDGKLSYWFGTFGLTSEGGAPGDFGMLLDADGNQPWTLYNRDQGIVPQGQWVHLASVRSGSTVRHYLNGQLLDHTGTFQGPIHVSDAFVAIGVNSLYNLAPNHTAFKGAIDEVHLYNRALASDEVRALHEGPLLRITGIAAEGRDLRLTWTCFPGRSYVVQASPALSSDGTGFVDLGPAIPIPAGFSGTTTNVLHPGALGTADARFYRVHQVP